MAYTRTKEPYSRREKQILNALPKNSQRITSNALTKKVYGNALSGRSSLIKTLGNLQKKTARNRERYRIHRTIPAGPYPIEIWIEDR